jgi:hypothetical protein
MKVKVRLEQTNEGLQAWVIQEGRRGPNLLKKRRTVGVGIAKNDVLTKLRGCEVEFELVGVEE